MLSQRSTTSPPISALRSTSPTVETPYLVGTEITRLGTNKHNRLSSDKGEPNSADDETGSEDVTGFEDDVTEYIKADDIRSETSSLLDSDGVGYHVDDGGDIDGDIIEDPESWHRYSDEATNCTDEDEEEEERKVDAEREEETEDILASEHFIQDEQRQQPAKHVVNSLPKTMNNTHLSLSSSSVLLSSLSSPAVADRPQFNNTMDQKVVYKTTRLGRSVTTNCTIPGVDVRTVPERGHISTSRRRSKTSNMQTIVSQLNIAQKQQPALTVSSINPTDLICRAITYEPIARSTTFSVVPNHLEPLQNTTSKVLPTPSDRSYQPLCIRRSVTRQQDMTSRGHDENMTESAQKQFSQYLQTGVPSERKLTPFRTTGYYHDNLRQAPVPEAVKDPVLLPTRFMTCPNSGQLPPSRAMSYLPSLVNNQDDRMMNRTPIEFNNSRSGNIMSLLELPVWVKASTPLRLRSQQVAGSVRKKFIEPCVPVHEQLNERYSKLYNSKRPATQFDAIQNIPNWPTIRPVSTMSTPQGLPPTITSATHRDLSGKKQRKHKKHCSSSNQKKKKTEKNLSLLFEQLSQFFFPQKLSTKEDAPAAKRFEYSKPNSVGIGADSTLRFFPQVSKYRQTDFLAVKSSPSVCPTPTVFNSSVISRPVLPFNSGAHFPPAWVTLREGTSTQPLPTIRESYIMN